MTAVATLTSAGQAASADFLQQRPQFTALKRPFIEIVVPVLNEEKILRQSITRLNTYLQQQLPYKYQITIADNGSSDATQSIARALTQELQTVETVRFNQRGRGRALKFVWQSSTADIVSYIDVGLSTDLGSFLPMIAPLVSGHEVCEALRKEGDGTPILMLTAKDQNRDIVKGLDIGADDYLPKPFSFEVLLARIRALLRRPNDKQDEVLNVGDLQLDPATRTVLRAGKSIKLTNKEYAVLEYLMRNAGKVLSKQNIISHVWDFDADVLPNNVELFIMFIRRKIDKPFDHPLIHTVSGFGYKIEDKA